MNSQEQLSLALFDILNEDIGSKKEIEIRRGAMDIHSTFFAGLAGPLLSVSSFTISGSKREGFRLPGSDYDLMASLKPNILRLSENDESNLYSMDHLPIELVCEESCPGFYKLHTRHPIPPEFIVNGFIHMQGKTYLRSDFNKILCVPNIFHGFLHGPCVQVIFSGDEVDIGVCLQCPFWPKSAEPWVQRCTKWPHRNVMERILKAGCHVMAIGSKDPILHNIEWRISFSMAELELIYSMNHSQFLVYGLLKLFLKDVLNDNSNESMLCSYYMKTVVFWEIQENPFPWDPCSIVACFWLCFKRLIKWVRSGFCPNFFIPNNNMFQGKIFGYKQELLLCQLLSLYDMGTGCLFQTSSINLKRVFSTIYPVLRSGNAAMLHSKQLFEIKTFSEIRGFNNKTFGLLHTMIKMPISCLRILENIVKYKHTEERKVTIQHQASITFRRLSFCIYNSFANLENKLFYRMNKLILSLLTMGTRFGNVSEMLYLCIFLYRTKRYEKVAYLLEDLNGRLNQPFLLYNDHVNIQKYEDIVGNSSLCVKLRKAVAFDIQLNNNISYIEELRLEQQIRNADGKCCLNIPVLVLLHMLRVLVNNKLHSVSRKRKALTDLYYLVHYDDGSFISCNLKDIAWNILGICQLVCRDFENAMQSFNECLQILKHVDDPDITQTPFQALNVRLQYTKSQFQCRRGCT